MPPVEDAVVETAEDGTTDQDLLDGFNGSDEIATPAKVGDEAKDEKVTDQPATEEIGELEETPTVEEKAADAPEFVQVTAAQLLDIQNAIKELPGIKDALHRGVSGMGSKVGTIEQALRKIQEAPAGKKVKLSREHFTELSKDFPDIVDMTVAGFNRGIENASFGSDAPAVDIGAKVKEGIDAAIPQIIATVEQSTSLKVMDGLRTGWLDEVQGKPYRDWLATQPAEYQTKINDSWEVADVWGSLKSFDESRKPKTKVTTAQRPSRLAAAITPRSAGSVSGRTSTANTEEAAMQEAFKRPR